ncbi:hypothetical protein BDV95DRAFT_603556 [Massariosphaeria phaeospora]|uniref:Uncharacterized protein n=1 Tax=Massariosphaeria phaeospora TaxID=100035 RepID=A0A7C8MGG8_9PLEO|nr:hypothetical protein BDV95DRAFT_603556 [Massariosphaeria phaeospora]
MPPNAANTPTIPIFTYRRVGRSICCDAAPGLSTARALGVDDGGDVEVDTESVLLTLALERTVLPDKRCVSGTSSAEDIAVLVLLVLAGDDDEIETKDAEAEDDGDGDGDADSVAEAVDAEEDATVVAAGGVSAGFDGRSAVVSDTMGMSTLKGRPQVDEEDCADVATASKNREPATENLLPNSYTPYLHLTPDNIGVRTLQVDLSHSYFSDTIIHPVSR